VVEDALPAVVEDVRPVAAILVVETVPARAIPVEEIVPVPAILAARRFSRHAQTPVVADRRTLAEVVRRIRVVVGRPRIVLRRVAHRNGDVRRRTVRRTTSVRTIAITCAGITVAIWVTSTG
jgi:hypothetical protein